MNVNVLIIPTNKLVSQLGGVQKMENSIAGRRVR